MFFVVFINMHSTIFQKGDQHHDDSVTIKNQEAIQIISSILKVSLIVQPLPSRQGQCLSSPKLIHG